MVENNTPFRKPTARFFNVSSEEAHSWFPKDGICFSSNFLASRGTTLVCYYVLAKKPLPNTNLETVLLVDVFSVEKWRTFHCRSLTGSLRIYCDSFLRFCIK